MIRTLLASTVLALAATACAAGPSAQTEIVASRSAITAAEVEAAQKAWSDNIVRIGRIHTEGGDARTAAAEHIRKFYDYDNGPVLFKPTLAREDQFRGTFDEALSYFVGGSIKEDKGFAITPWTKVRWENEGTILKGDSAVAMGNYFFTNTKGEDVKVEYTFAYRKAADGSLKITLHHSSVPFAG